MHALCILFSLFLCENRNSHLLSDPTSEEESLASQSCTIVFDVAKAPDALLSVYKPGGSALTLAQVMQCIEQGQIQIEKIKTTCLSS
jgi:exosome complex RNA-binding protein Rrp42 (RNase PH superfamily)